MVKRRMYKEEEESEVEGEAHMSVSEGRSSRVFCVIRKYVDLQVGSRASNTYKMTRFKEVKNCNEKFQNR